MFYPGPFVNCLIFCLSKTGFLVLSCFRDKDGVWKMRNEVGGTPSCAESASSGKMSWFHANLVASYDVDDWCRDPTRNVSEVILREESPGFVGRLARLVRRLSVRLLRLFGLLLLLLLLLLGREGPQLERVDAVVPAHLVPEERVDHPVAGGLHLGAEGIGGDDQPGSRVSEPGWGGGWGEVGVDGKGGGVEGDREGRMGGHEPEVRLRGGVADHGLVVGVEVGVIVNLKGRGLQSGGDLISALAPFLPCRKASPTNVRGQKITQNKTLERYARDLPLSGWRLRWAWWTTWWTAASQERSQRRTCGTCRAVAGGCAPPCLVYSRRENPMR